MTDRLERLWDEIQVGPAPVNRIIRAAKAEQPRPRARRELRPLATVGVLAGLVGAFAVGTMVGQPPSSGPGGGPRLGTPPGAPTVAAAFHGDLQPAESCAELLDHYVGEALDRVGPYGWETGYYTDVRRFAGDAMVQLDGSMRGTLNRELAYAKAPISQRSESSATGTNVQEAGVDEPDVVKTDGSLLVRLKDATITTYDVSGAEVDELGSVDLGLFEDGEILLAGDTVVAIGDDGTRPPRDDYYYDDEEQTSPMTRVMTVDVSDPADPALLDTVDYDSSLGTARQHGDDVRLVLAAGLPDLDFVRPMRGKGAKSAREANQAIVRDTTLDDWLPHVTTGGGSSDELVECPDVAIPETDLGLDTMAVVGFPADDPRELDAIALAGDAPLAYESPDHLYLATQGFSDLCCFDGRAAEAGTTHVYDFEVDGTSATYVGSGEVEGSVADRWAMDEYDGVLRLAVGPTSETGNFNSVVTLRAEGDELVELGRVDRLGVNEQIEAVRWFDGLAIVVTFRQIDPLYAIDLTDASEPTLLGQLKIPGFSEYLHPLGEHRLVGMGQGPVDGGRWGAQAGLFNVTDLTRPRRLDVVGYAPNTTALAGGDPRQFTWLPGTRTVLTVIAKGYSGRTGWVSVLSLGGGQMQNRMVQVEYGSDVDEVRLVPLPEDRVVLVTGEDVEFFDV